MEGRCTPLQSVVRLKLITRLQLREGLRFQSLGCSRFKIRVEPSSDVVGLGLTALGQTASGLPKQEFRLWAPMSLEAHRFALGCESSWQPCSLGRCFA